MIDREALIRQRAHQIWEEEGCPEGRSEAHWQQALAELEDVPDEDLEDMIDYENPAADPPGAPIKLETGSLPR